MHIPVQNVDTHIATFTTHIQTHTSVPIDTTYHSKIQCSYLHINYILHVLLYKAMNQYNCTHYPDPSIQASDSKYLNVAIHML